MSINYEFVDTKNGLTLKKAKSMIDQFVVADGGYYGVYIGKLENVIFEDNRWYGIVWILEITRYPIIDSDYLHEKWESSTPFEYKARFPLEFIIEYIGEENFYGTHYMESREKALNKAYSIINKYANNRGLKPDEKNWLKLLYGTDFNKEQAQHVLNVLRLHAKLFDMNIIKKKVKVDRTPWTDWIITINEPSNNKYYDVFYRTTWREGRECELFTLVAMGTDHALMQLYIFNDEVNHITWVPCAIRTNHEKKTIFIDLLCHIEAENPNSIQMVTLSELNVINKRIIGL